MIIRGYLVATAIAIMTDLSSGIQIHSLNLHVYKIIYYVDVNVDLINNDTDSESDSDSLNIRFTSNTFSP